MNLSAYDSVKPKIDKTKTWVDTEKQILYSREIQYRPYVTLSKRYDPVCCDYEYFVILLDDYPEDRQYSRTNKDDYGRIKIKLTGIFKDCGLSELGTTQNISIEHIEHTDDGDIYKIGF